jgi:uncharacterized Fe-S cluster protein YjdI
METEERKRAGVAREYRNDAIAVQWSPEYCIHTGRCIMAQPAVFDPGRRPWVILEGATADDIADAVLRCPTGALHFTRLDDGSQEEPGGETYAVPVKNGPLFVSGPISITDSDGNVVREDTRVALCRCGSSDNKPFCDGTHRTIGFKT